MTFSLWHNYWLSCTNKTNYSYKVHLLRFYKKTTTKKKITTGQFLVTLGQLLAAVSWPVTKLSSANNISTCSEHFSVPHKFRKLLRSPLKKMIGPDSNVSLIFEEIHHMFPYWPYFSGKQSTLLTSYWDYLLMISHTFKDLFMTILRSHFIRIKTKTVA